MADEAEQESGGGGGGLMKIILPVVALLLGAGGGYFMGSSMGSKQVVEAEKLEPTPEQKARKPEEMVGVMFKLDPFVVNLNEPKGNRYLKTTIQLEMDDGGKKGDAGKGGEKKEEQGKEGAAAGKSPLEQELERRKPQLQDVILALLTSKSSRELQALEGKFRLREELLARINALLVNGSITRVYFTEFVIQ
ncbi:MAG: flagellar basal body-associated FliL family protein [Magnetococcales bacterium]|jgi:flagellar FliL protein|nr:flagellar basal body-associated FliL family protein [Magnetococcales bacterium]